MTAKPAMPRMSPHTFGSSSARSRNEDVHWHIASSVAPANRMDTKPKRKIFERSSVRTGVASASLTFCRSGTRRKIVPQAIGNTAQPQRISGQRSMPKTAISTVVTTTVTTCPIA